MIRKSLRAVKAATFCVHLPSTRLGGMPAAAGSGFFVAPDGWFVTAAHVITEDGSPTGKIRTDIDKMWALKELIEIPELCTCPTLMHADPINDLALLKFESVSDNSPQWLKMKGSYPFVEISLRAVDEGEPVYSFGYPLSESQNLSPPLVQDSQDISIQMSGTIFSPRVTSAVVASQFYLHGPNVNIDDPKKYVIDKALNYGNSGGPIIATETGKVFAVCTMFQPVFIPQTHLGNPPPAVMLPSLYGVVSSLSNVPFVAILNEHGVSVSTD